MRTTVLLLTTSLTALLASACGGATLAQSPFGATPASDGNNVTLATTTDDSNSAIGPTPAAIDGPAPPATDGMTPATVKLPGSDRAVSPKPTPAVNVSGSADHAPDMTQ